MRPLVHLSFGALLLSSVALHAGAAGTNKLCNGRQTDIVFAVIHEDSTDSGSRCDPRESRCYVTLQGWYTMKPGVCMNVDTGTRWESYLPVGPFKKKQPGALAPLLNPAIACDPGEALHPVNFLMRAGPETHVVVTVN